MKMKSVSQGGRIAQWDNARCLLVFLVVMGHFISTYTTEEMSSDLCHSLFAFIYAFHMPAMFFLSGLFHRNRDIKTKVFGYLTLYIIMKTLLFILDWDPVEVPAFNIFSESGSPWFLLTLPMMILLVYGTRDLNQRVILALAVLLGIMSGYDKMLKDFLALSRFFVFFPFYMAGTMANRRSLEKFSCKVGVKIGAAAILAISLIYCLMNVERSFLLRQLLTGRNYFFGDVRPAGYWYRIEYYMLVTLMGLAAILVVPGRRLPLVTAYGQRTLPIYFWHIMFRQLLMKFGVHEMLYRAGAAGKLVWLLLGAATFLICGLPVFEIPLTAVLNTCRRLRPDGDRK